jgi:demethylmenaquinone methyltransferase/2-methoxy-6-polyprenyl-1,4-benzoquinol methylase
VSVDDLIAEQRCYYAARAPEYEDWWFRRGRYDRGAAENAAWFDEVAELEAALDDFGASGDVLELACGTGLWTRRLQRTAGRLVAVDASAETLELSRTRTGRGVEYVQADVFEWVPTERFDVCFFSFWLSHVPAQRFDDFWALVAGALRPGGRVFLIDSAAGDTAHPRPDGEELELRQLHDGREFRIVKRHWEPDELVERVARLGWSLDVRRTRRGHLLYGSGSR